MELPKIALFDLDGTILDNTEIVVAAYQSALKSLQYPVPDYEFVASLGGMSILDTTIALGVGEQDFEAVNQHFWNFFGEYCSTLDQNNMQPVVIESAELVLQYLRNNNVRMGVVTSNSHANADFLLNKANLHHYFDIIVGKEDILEKSLRLKPSADPVYYALNLLQFTNYSKADVAFIGDSPADALCGLNAGVTAIIVNSHYRNHVTPDYHFKKFADLLAIIENIY